MKFGEPADPSSSVARVVVAESAAEFVALATQHVARVLHQRLEESSPEGRVRMALSGGSTPGPVYERLARVELPWPRIEIGFADERCVPLDDPDSNFALVRKTLLDTLATQPAAVLRMEGEDGDREAAARRYEGLMERPFDLVILGVGEDGHTASLFPGSSALDEKERLVLAVRGPKPPPERLTLAPRALREAAECIVLVRGEAKAEIVAAALGGAAPESCPASLARGGIWVLDQAAAAKLPREDSAH